MNSLLKDMCQAFCGDLAIREIGMGYAVKTPFRGEDGDAIAVYIRKDRHNPSQFRLEDSGDTIAYMQSFGFSLESEQRSLDFTKLLTECGCQYDDKEYLIHTEYVPENVLPTKFLKFMEMLIRIEDFRLLSKEKVRETFKADLIEFVKSIFKPNVSIEVEVPAMEGWQEFISDIVVSYGDKKLAIYAGHSEVSALEAFCFSQELAANKITNVTPFLMLQTAKPSAIKSRTMTRIMNSNVQFAAMDGGKTDIAAKLSSSIGYQLLH